MRRLLSFGRLLIRRKRAMADMPVFVDTNVSFDSGASELLFYRNAIVFTDDKGQTLGTRFGEDSQEE